MGLIVSTIRKLQLQFNAVSAGEWAADIRTKWFSQAHEIAGKTVGIVGLGRIGSRVARRLQGWECEVVYSDIIDIPEELEQELNVTRLPLDEVLQTADVITLHVPLGTQTRHMISDREFDMMKPTVIFINACRGPVVDEAALIRALNDGKVAAAGLDVLEQEPTPVDNPLLKMDNVLVTPHLAAFSQEAGEKSRMFAITNSARVAGGDEPDSVVPSTDF
jgi:phosphoglycerate dehydrogenase-like enzyme